MVDRTTAATSTETATAEIATLRQMLAAAYADKTKSTRTPALLPSIIARPDGVPSTAAATTEVATLRQKLKAAAAIKGTQTLDSLHKRTAALLPDPTRHGEDAGRHRAGDGRASESANAAPEWPRLVAGFIAGELGFAGMA
jgi:hypothetical protein